MSLVSSVINATHDFGISSDMDSLTSLGVYLIMFVMVVYSLRQLINHAEQIAVDLLVILPIKLCNAVFALFGYLIHKIRESLKKANAYYKELVESAKEGKEELAQAKQADSESEIHQNQESEKSDSDALKLARKAAAVMDSISRTPLEIPKASEPDLSTPSYLKLSKPINDVYYPDGHHCVPQCETNDEPETGEAVVTRRQLREQKKLSKRMVQLQAHTYSSKGLNA